MTTEPRVAARTRFLRALARWIGVWQWTIVVALVVTALGLVPSLIGIVALGGVVWVPIVVLSLWGRMLDETMQFRSDVQEGPW